MDCLCDIPCLSRDGGFSATSSRREEVACLCWLLPSPPPLFFSITFSISPMSASASTAMARACDTASSPSFCSRAYRSAAFARSATCFASPGLRARSSMARARSPAAIRSSSVRIRTSWVSLTPEPPGCSPPGVPASPTRGSIRGSTIPARWACSAAIAPAAPPTPDARETASGYAAPACRNTSTRPRDVARPRANSANYLASARELTLNTDHKTTWIHFAAFRIHNPSLLGADCEYETLLEGGEPVPEGVAPASFPRASPVPGRETVVEDFHESGIGRPRPIFPKFPVQRLLDGLPGPPRRLCGQHTRQHARERLFGDLLPVTPRDITLLGQLDHEFLGRLLEASVAREHPPAVLACGGVVAPKLHDRVHETRQCPRAARAGRLIPARLAEVVTEHDAGFLREHPQRHERFGHEPRLVLLLDRPERRERVHEHEVKSLRVDLPGDVLQERHPGELRCAEHERLDLKVDVVGDAEPIAAGGPESFRFLADVEHLRGLHGATAEHPTALECFE